MKIIKAIALTALSFLILSGCSAEKAKVEEEVKVKDVPNEEEVKEAEIETVEEEEVKAEQLESPYSEIAEYFSEWELPKEGILPKDHEAYEGALIEAVAYDNGFVFSEETELFVGTFFEEGMDGIPTKEQLPGITMGIISRAAESLAFDEETELDKYVISLNTMMLEMDFKDLLKHANQEELINVSTEIVNSAVELRKIADEEEVSEAEFEKLAIRYNELVDKVYQLNKTINLDELS